MSCWVQRARRHARGAVKRILLDLLEESGGAGLNAPIAVAMAAERDVSLDRATLSSLLSRLKADGLVDHDGYRYRLRAFPNRTHQRKTAEVPSFGRSIS